MTVMSGGGERLRQRDPQPGRGRLCPQRVPLPTDGKGGDGTPYLFPAPPCLGCHRRTCKERASALTPLVTPPGTQGCIPPDRLLSWVLGLCPTHPCTPFLGGLLLNCLVCLCLNLGGPFRGVAGPPVTLVADLISGLGGSRLMAVPGLAAGPGSRLSLCVRRWHRRAPHT